MRLDAIVISDSARDLIRSMLCPESERLTAKQVLNHPFIKNHKDREPDIDPIKNMKSRILHMKEHAQHRSLFQRIVYSSLTQRLTYKNFEDLKKIFEEMDKDYDGVISKQEFFNGIKEVDSNKTISEKELEGIFNLIDTNKTHKIDYTEFVSAFIDKKFFDSKEKLLEIFQTIDTENTGKISYNDYINFVNMEGIHKKDLKELQLEFERADLDKDGYIEYEEFVQYITKRGEEHVFKKKEQKNNKGWYCLFIF